MKQNHAMTDPIQWTQARRRLGDLSPWPRNPRQIKTAKARRLVVIVGQMSYNLGKEMPRRYANTPRRDDWIRASHMSIVPRAPVACHKERFFMTMGDGKPCRKCGTSEWYKGGACKECVRRNTRRWRKTNPEKSKERQRRWYAANSEKDKERSRRWLEANPEKVKERSRLYKQTHPEAHAANEHRRRTRKTTAGGSYSAAEWKALCDHYGNKCLCCGRDDVRLTADHVVPVVKGGTSNIDNIQPLCDLCNKSKGTKHIDYRPGSGLGRWIQKKLFG